jgi:hypothetical protein
MVDPDPTASAGGDAAADAPTAPESAGASPAPAPESAGASPAPAPEPAAAAPAPAPPTGRRAQPPPVPQLVTELRDLVVTYVKQQTLAPLQQLGRYVGFGIGGSLLLGFGVVFLALAGLRALQTETGTTFTGDWSWVPYLIMVFVLVLGAALVWLFRTARRAEREAR